MPCFNFVRSRFLSGGIAIGLLLLSACATTPVDERHNTAAIIGKQWQWQGTVTPVSTVTVPHPERYTLTLMPDGRAQMHFDCNRGSSSYSVAPGQLELNQTVSTRMACLPGSLDGVYMKQLGQIRSFFIDQGDLYLEMPIDGGTMRFKAAP